MRTPAKASFGALTRFFPKGQTIDQCIIRL
jgi:hypothetical protein